MVTFNNTFDLGAFQECVQYVQDSLDWLVARELDNRESILSEAVLGRTAEQFEALLHHNLRYLQNARTPVNRLPVEILGHIFLYLQDDCDYLYALDYYYCLYPPRDVWHLPSLVCRHWRWIINNTPQLWTTLKYSEHAAKRFADNEWPWSTVGLSRSGSALPLTIHFQARIDAIRIERPDITRILDEAPRFRDLRFLDTYPDPLGSIISKARHLRILMVDNRQESLTDAPLHLFNDTYDLPRLQVLSTHNCMVWRACSTQNLRHLSLVNQNWTIPILRDFLRVLASNLLIEELFMIGIIVPDEEWDGTAVLSKRSSPIHMSKLTRLLVQDPQLAEGFVCPISMILSKHLVLPVGCARYHTLCASTDPCDVFDSREQFPTDKLFITPGFIMGTDGVSAFKVMDGRLDRFISEVIDRNNVRELWLRSNYCSWPPQLLAAVCDLHGVVKLFLSGNVSLWLTQFKAQNSFPALKELHVLTQSTVDGQPIIRCLSDRKRNGLQLETFRVVHNPWSTFYHDKPHIFYSWRKSSWKFARLVGRAIFEDMRRDPQTNQFIPESFELPGVCNLSSPTCPFWNPWPCGSLPW
ncbi:hypothetical protein BC629DRAFT_1495787 [Irpex lacteus]|nr:hypothetical protein BC629DRAFT_1495787 [Irpex lacteus]